MLPKLIVLLVLALPPADSYNQGNRAYAQKDYARAARLYQEALAAGPNAEVHYNLGNALFKAGKIGEAIAHYRRAHYLNPRDADIGANLSFARNYRVDKMLSVPSPLARALDDAFHWLSRREASLLAATFFALAGLALAAWILWRWTALVAGALAFAALSLFCFVTQQVWTGEVNSHPAVVVVPEVDALSGPSEEFKQILLLHDGSEVAIREARGDYLLVQLPGGSGGWIRKSAVERVY